MFEVEALTIHFNQWNFLLIYHMQLPFQPRQTKCKYLTFLQIKSQMQPWKVSEVVDAPFGVQLLVKSLVDESQSEDAFEVCYFCHEFVVVGEEIIDYLHNHTPPLLLHVVLDSITQNFLPSWQKVHVVPGSIEEARAYAGVVEVPEIILPRKYSRKLLSRMLARVHLFKVVLRIFRKTILIVVRWLLIQDRR